MQNRIHRWKGIDLRMLGLSDEEHREHEQGRGLLSTFWGEHEELVVEDLDEIVTDPTRVAIGGDNSKIIYETEVQGIPVVCKTYKLRRSRTEVDLEDAKRAISKEYKVRSRTSICKRTSSYSYVHIARIARTTHLVKNKSYKCS